MDYSELPWRVGNTVRRTIYAVIPEVGEKNHPLIGLMDTAKLAADAVAGHNNALSRKADRSTFAEKEQLIKDLDRTLDVWSGNNHNLEEAIIVATGGHERSMYVYTAIGNSSDILGPDADIPRVIAHAVNLVRSS